MKVNYIPASVAKEYIEELAKKGELNDIQRETLKHLQKTVKIKPEEAKKLMQELISIGLSEFVAAKIIDIMPSSLDEIRSIVFPHITNLETEMGNKILEILSKYR